MILVLAALGFWVSSSGWFGVLTTANSCVYFLLHKELHICDFTQSALMTSCGEGSNVRPSVLMERLECQGSLTAQLAPCSTASVCLPTQPVSTSLGLFSHHLTVTLARARIICFNPENMSANNTRNKTNLQRLRQSLTVSMETLVKERFCAVITLRGGTESVHAAGGTQAGLRALLSA